MIDGEDAVEKDEASLTIEATVATAGTTEELAGATGANGE